MTTDDQQKDGTVSKESSHKAVEDDVSEAKPVQQDIATAPELETVSTVTNIVSLEALHTTTTISSPRSIRAQLTLDQIQNHVSASAPIAMSPRSAQRPPLPPAGRAIPGYSLSSRGHAVSVQGVASTRHSQSLAASGFGAAPSANVPYNLADHYYDGMDSVHSLSGYATISPRSLSHQEDERMELAMRESRKEHFEGSGSTDPTACAHDEIPPTGGGGISSWRDAPAAQPSGASASSSSAPVPARDSNEASSSQATVVPPRNSNRAFLDAIPTSCVPVVIPKAPAQPNPFHGQFARGVAKPKPKGNGGPKAKAHSRAPVNLPKSVPVRVPKAPAASLIMPLNVHLPGSVAAGVVHAPEFLPLRAAVTNLPRSTGQGVVMPPAMGPATVPALPPPPPNIPKVVPAHAPTQIFVPKQPPQPKAKLGKFNPTTFGRQVTNVTNQNNNA